ncbi:MAG: CAP domain-containing protein, partial [Propionibacteriaceae bacterium]|nr:CAP domain-containing protein [Propionibacteriaceae bacterium]
MCLISTAVVMGGFSGLSAQADEKFIDHPNFVEASDSQLDEMVSGGSSFVVYFYRVDCYNSQSMRVVMSQLMTYNGITVYGRNVDQTQSSTYYKVYDKVISIYSGSSVTLPLVGVFKNGAIDDATSGIVPVGEVRDKVKAAGIPNYVEALPVSGPLDRTSQQAVTDAYLNTYIPALDQPLTWSGSTETCTPGQLDAAAQAATFTTINYFRAMAGLQPVSESVAASASAQQAALIMAAKNNLSHYPPSDWPCWSQEGYYAAGHSNLYLGYSGAQAIAGYIDDPGASNTAVGHRRWILYPPTSTMGSGSTASSNALRVFGSDVDSSNPYPEGGVAWPAAGYFPYRLLPSSGRWSYSAAGENFASASIVVKKNGSSVDATVVNRDNAGYGDGTIVWTIPAPTEPDVSTVDHYQVSITGIANPVTYTVDVYSVASVVINSVSFSGSGAYVGATVNAQVSVTP